MKDLDELTDNEIGVVEGYLSARYKFLTKLNEALQEFQSFHENFNDTFDDDAEKHIETIRQNLKKMEGDFYEV